MEDTNQNAAPQVHKKNGKKHVILTLILIVTVLAVIYVGFAIFFQTHFNFGTTIDGISVGGCSAEKVEQFIKNEVENYSLRLIEREDGEEAITGNSIAIAPIFNGEVERLLQEQNGFAWIVTLFQKEELALEKVVTFDEKALEQELKSLECVKPKNQREPVNASYSEYTKDGYILVPADYGTTIDMAGFKRAVSNAILTLEDEIILEENGCYVEPQIGDDNEKLLALLDDLNSYAGTVITYTFGKEKEVLDGKTISDWISDENLQILVDRDAVAEYVKTLAKTYNTAYRPKTLLTSYGKEVTISNGSYGWKIDQTEEIEQILADLKAGEAVEREPVYSQTANSREENDYGDSYVEINLTAQHLFVYKDGELIVESDFVSGDVAKGHTSPTGAYGVTYTTTNAVLRGEDYATPVKYWMPFAGDVGMHDATWRRSFGGGIYLTNGSHGCINLPLSVAKTIYNTIEKGYAVLVYTLPGTEGASVLQQEADNVINTINSIGTVTLESETVIVAARNMYNALPDTAKALVTNYDVLVSAETVLAELKGTV